VEALVGTCRDIATGEEGSSRAEDVPRQSDNLGATSRLSRKNSASTITLSGAVASLVR